MFIWSFASKKDIFEPESEHKLLGDVTLGDRYNELTAMKINKVNEWRSTSH